METASKATADTPAVLKPIHFLVLALFAGLLCGLSEGIYFQSRLAMGKTYFLFLNQDFFWMTGVTNALLFLAFGSLFFGLSFVVSRRRLGIAAVGFFSFLLFLGVLLLYARKLHDLANVALAFGLAMALTRHVGHRVPQWIPGIRRLVFLLVALNVICAGVTAGKRYWAEQDALSQLPVAKKEAPNVLVITWDTVRADNCSLFGYKRSTTPQLEKWSKKGVVFSNAISTAPWTLPAHASMFTGRYPHEFTASWLIPLDKAHATVAEVLRDQGYQTAGFVANRPYCSYETGLQRGFIHYEDYSYQPGEFILCSKLASRLFTFAPVRRALDYFAWYGHITAEQVNNRFYNWLDKRDQERPFFVFMNYFDSHDPYLPPAPFDRKFGPPPTQDDKELMLHWYDCVAETPTKKEHDTAMQLYDGGIAYQDDQFGELLENLKARGILDNTLVIIAGDHGEHFGEHDLYMHGHTLYRENIHVPMMLLYGDHIPHNTTVKQPVTLRDMAATVLDLTQAKNANSLPGNSWSRYWTSTGEIESLPTSALLQIAFTIPKNRCQPGRGQSPVASGNLASLVFQGKTYIKNLETGKEELFDLENDPDELTNLVDEAGEQQALRNCREELKRVFENHSSWWDNIP